MAHSCSQHRHFKDGCEACRENWDRLASGATAKFEELMQKLESSENETGCEIKRIALPEGDAKFPETVKALESKIIESMMLPESMINCPNAPINIPLSGRYSLFSTPRTYEPFPEYADEWTTS